MNTPENEPRSRPGRGRSRAERQPIGRPASHHAHQVARILKTVPLATVDGRSEAARFLHRTRHAILEQLGGEAMVTPAQLILVEKIATTALITRAAENYIAGQSSIVRDGALLPVVMQHAQLVTSLARLLARLGLKRVPAAPATLADYLKSKQTP